SYSGAISPASLGPYCIQQTDAVMCYPADYYVLNLNGGSDNFTVANGSYFQTMTVNGGPGDDSLDTGGLATTRGLPSANRFNGAANDGEPNENDNVGGDIEEIDGTPNNDVLTGNDLGQTINGNGGDDTIDGRGGDDYVVGAQGNDSIIGGAGKDIIYGDNTTCG